MIYSVYSAGGVLIARTIIQRQAVHAAQQLAARLSAPAFIERRNMTTGEARRVQLNADGSIVQLWRGGLAVRS